MDATANRNEEIRKLGAFLFSVVALLVLFQIVVVHFIAPWLRRVCGVQQQRRRW